MCFRAFEALLYHVVYWSSLESRPRGFILDPTTALPLDFYAPSRARDATKSCQRLGSRHADAHDPPTVSCHCVHKKGCNV